MTEGRQFKGPSFDDGQAGRVIASLAVAVMIDQMWSLAQFYSVDFSQSWIGLVCVSCFLRCPGTSDLTVSLFLCSSGSSAQVKGP